MRLVLAVLVLVGPLVAVAPVRAHSCAAPVHIPVRERASVTVGVAAEAAAVTGVDVDVPEGFRLSAVGDGSGWQVERDGSAVRFRDGSVPAFGCAYFSLEGVAERKGRLLFPLTLHTADGQSLRYDSAEPGDERAAQLVFAGVEPGGADDAGTTWWPVAGGGLVVLALVVAAGLALRRIIPRPPRHVAARSGGGGRGQRGSGLSRSRSRTRRRPRRS